MAYSSIIKPQDYFNTKLYTGNGSTNAQTGVGFQPDMVWIKSRTNNSDHVITDAVRGVTKEIRPNKTDYEDTASNGLTTFGTDGFTVGDWTVVNLNSETYASWNWKANGAGSSNSDGSVTSTVSANTTSGFSIVKFDPTGAACTIGHGLGVAPKVIIAKALNRAFSWVWGGDAIGWTKYLELNETQAEATSTARWNDTAPTSTVFSVKNEYNSGDNVIAYCFAEKNGFSKFGSYTGNGNADGPFIYTGFKPAWIMIKSATTVQSWMLFDNKRLGFNPDNDYLLANSTAVEPADEEVLDIVSNGFKPRVTAGTLNTSGQTYIYMAFAENPFVANVDGGLPTTAR